MKTLIVEDHQLISTFLKYYLNEHFPKYDVKLINTNTDHILQNIVAHNPELVVLDISLNDVDSMDFFESLKTALPQTYFIIYTMHNIASYINFFYQQGANAYVLKEDAQLDLKDVINKVLVGERIFPNIETLVDQDYRLNQLTFTETEKRMLAALLETTDTDELVDKLNCNKLDILNMRRKLLNKCNAENTQQLINYTRKYHWIR